MLCKRIAPTILALLMPISLAALASLATTGCGGSNETAVVTPEPPAPPLGSDAGVAGIAISTGVLTPAFSPNINNYGAEVGLLGETSVGLTVTLRDPNARLTVGNLLTVSGLRVNVPLSNGLNPVSVKVTSEDGKVANTIDITFKKVPLSTGVYVLNGIGGVPVKNVKLRLTDARGAVLAEDVPLPPEKMGQKIFALDPGQKYNIYAKADFSAAACFANFDPAKEDTAALYCVPTSTTYYELTAPVIEEIAFATANSNTADWKVMPSEARYEGPASGVFAVRVTAVTRNPMQPSSIPFGYDEWDVGNARTPYPMLLALDNMAAANAGGAAPVTGTVVGTANTPATINGATWYRNTYRFATPLLNTGVSLKEHFISVVVADMICNRTEQRVYLTITDTNPATVTEPDLSGWAPGFDLVQGQTFVGQGNLIAGRERPGESPNAVGGDNDYTGMTQVIIQFYATSDGTSSGAAMAHRGYEVWRSLGDQSNFVKIATVNFATVNSTAAAMQYLDRQPSLEVGDVYYKVRFFNGNPNPCILDGKRGYSLFSPSIKALVLPPFYARPADGYALISNSIWPTFKLATTDPGILRNDQGAGQFRFCVVIKNADDYFLFALVPFLINFGGRMAGDTGDTYDWAGHQGAVYMMDVTSYSYSTSAISGTWIPATDYKDVVDPESGTTTRVFTPFAYIEDGVVIVKTDSETLQYYVDNAVRSTFSRIGEQFKPGTTYLYNFMGNNAGIAYGAGDGVPGYWETTATSQAAWVGKGYNTNGSTFLGCAYGSSMYYGWGSPEGWFPLIITPDAH